MSSLDSGPIFGLLITAILGGLAWLYLFARLRSMDRRLRRLKRETTAGLAKLSGYPDPSEVREALILAEAALSKDDAAKLLDRAGAEKLVTNHNLIATRMKELEEFISSLKTSHALREGLFGEPIETPEAPKPKGS